MSRTYRVACCCLSVCMYVCNVCACSYTFSPSAYTRRMHPYRFYIYGTRLLVCVFFFSFFSSFKGRCSFFLSFFVVVICLQQGLLFLRVSVPLWSDIRKLYTASYYLLPVFYAHPAKYDDGSNIVALTWCLLYVLYLVRTSSPPYSIVANMR